MFVFNPPLTNSESIRAMGYFYSRYLVKMDKKIIHNPRLASL